MIIICYDHSSHQIFCSMAYISTATVLTLQSSAASTPIFHFLHCSVTFNLTQIKHSRRSLHSKALQIMHDPVVIKITFSLFLRLSLMSACVCLHLSPSCDEAPGNPLHPHSPPPIPIPPPPPPPLHLITLGSRCLLCPPSQLLQMTHSSAA